MSVRLVDSDEMVAWPNGHVHDREACPLLSEVLRPHLLRQILDYGPLRKHGSIAA